MSRLCLMLLLPSLLLGCESSSLDDDKPPAEISSSSALSDNWLGSAVDSHKKPSWHLSKYFKKRQDLGTSFRNPSPP